jgi:hypothetical protein
MEQEILNLGALAVIAAIAIEKFFLFLKFIFNWVKEKKNGSNYLPDIMIDIRRELELMNTNHLNSIKECIEKGQSKIMDTNTEMLKVMIEMNTNLKLLVDFMVKK